MELWGDIGSLGIQNERNSSGMGRGMAKKNANTGAIDPPIVGMASLEARLQDINRRAKRMKIPKVNGGLKATENGEGGADEGGR